MNEAFQKTILTLTSANSMERVEEIQSLWSGYGHISRYRLIGAVDDVVVIKHVKLPDQNLQSQPAHPRGWNTHLSHQRKVKSYQVESHWYEAYSEQCNQACMVPKCFGALAKQDEFLIVQQDLDNAGYGARKKLVTPEDMQPCLRWLANFHATFLVDTTKTVLKTKGLWQTGCYWHLATRPDELAAMKDEELKAAAFKIDALLNNCRYQTLVHGDAKLANFCFSDDLKQVAAVDFQYVGGGIGMKDLAYFIGSCLHEQGCEQYSELLLDDYFQYLREAIKVKKTALDFDSIENEWRPLFIMAWADFHRFLKGWSPDHWKINSFSESITREALSQISS